MERRMERCGCLDCSPSSISDEKLQPVMHDRGPSLPTERLYSSTDRSFVPVSRLSQEAEPFDHLLV